MKYLSLFALLVLLCHTADASILDVFKDESGHTKWQHVANFTGSVLILLLSFTLAGLTFSQIQIRLRNKELREIKKNLEKTVQKRTENLNLSYTLLQQSNQALEGEIDKHKETSTQLFSSQNYLQSILASMPSMLIGLNKQLEVTHWNKTAEEITGLTPNDVLGKNLWDAYPSITLSAEEIQSVLTSRQTKVIKHSQRGQYYFDITIFPLAEEHSGVVIIVENVTQRSLAENQLIQRDKLASVGELASTMAHDINIPLQGILKDVEAAHTQLTALKDVPEDTTELLEDAVRTGKKASIIVNNLLDFSASQGSEKYPESITEILEHCVELGVNTLSEESGLHFKDIKIERKYEDDIPQIPCYAAELQQVFLSLFRHACYAMNLKEQSNYQPTITLEVIKAYSAIWVKVQHNGVGLSGDQQHDIFEPIVQHSDPTIQKRIIAENRLSFPHFIVTEHHQGQMAVTSDPEVGTTFHIQLVAD